MFFIFSYDLLVFVVLLVIFIIMLVAFPTITLILTGLCIWGLVAALKGRGEGGEDETE